MKHEWEFELKALQAAQEDLRQRLEKLDERTAQLQARLSAETEPMEPSVVEPESHGRIIDPFLPVEGRVPSPEPEAVILEVPAPISKIAVPPPLPPFDSPVAESVTPPPLEPQLPRNAKVVKTDSAEGLEMKVGKYWLVRIGLLVLLTGLVLLGNLAYHSFITQFGATGKLALMLLTGVALLGLGGGLERRGQKIRNYARALMAGGAAVVYYTAYAAHFVDSLRVIESPIFAGALLLGLAGSFAWFAERRRSQGTAFAAIFLAYYASVINPAQQFTLFSNVLLTALAAFLLIRHRWYQVTWLALVGSYASFAYWRWPSFDAGGDLWVTHGFLVAYWLLFTLTVFLNRASTFSGAHRSFFLTANNAAFFALAAPTVARAFPSEFWVSALAYAVVLLGLSALAWWIKREDRGFDGTYLAQGLLMLTLAGVTKFSGYELAIILMIESAALLTLSRFRHAALYQWFAALAAVASFALVLADFSEGAAGWVAALLLFNAWHLKHLRKSLREFRFEIGAVVYALPGMMLGGMILLHRFEGNELIWALSAAALIFSGAGYVLRLPEIALFAQGHLAAALVALVIQGLTWPTAVPFLLAVLILMHAWQWRKTVNPWLGRVFEALDALIVVGTLYLWLFPFSAEPTTKMFAGVSAGLLMLLYGMGSRARILAGFSQLFTLTGIVSFLDVLWDPPSVGWSWTLGAWLVIAAQAALFRAVPAESAALVRPLAVAYRAMTAFLALIWILQTFPAPWYFFLLTLVAMLILIPAALKRSGEYLAYAATSLAGAGLAYLIQTTQGFTALNLFALILVLLTQQLGKWLLRTTTWFPQVLQSLLAGGTILAIWIEVSRWSQSAYPDLALTLVWAVLALFFLAAGFGLRERSYRLMGLAMLTVAVGYVFFVDVWALGQLARILGMFGLAAILIFLGYIYNRYAEQIKKWL